MGFFDEWLVPIFGVAAAAATGGAAAPALAGTEAATAAGTAAATTGAVAEGATALNLANSANAVNLANTGSQAANLANVANTANAVPGLAGITSGLPEVGMNLAGTAGTTGSGIMQAAPGITSAVPEVAATAPELATATQTVVPEAAGNISQGIKEIGPNMGQVNPVNPANYGNAVPGEAAITEQTLSPVTNTYPEAFNTSAGRFTGVTPPVPSALERGFDKALAWAEKNPIMAAYGASSVVNGILGPQQPQTPKKKPSSGPKYTLASDFQGTTDNPQPYKWGYAEGGIASLAQGGMGGNQGYPQGRLDTTQYATPSQMPTSAQVVNADYEVPTDPYMGSPLKMAEGGIARYAFGGSANAYGVPYFSGARNLSELTAGDGSPTGNMYGMGGKGKGGAKAKDTTPPEFNSPTIVPNVYNSGYGQEAAAEAPVSNIPMLQAIQNSQQQMNSAYDMLAQTAPNIATMSGAPPSAFQNAATTAAAPATTTAAQGGIMGYNRGGIPGPDIDTGIVSEDDPDFAFTSPYQTAAGRLEKLYKKTHINRKPPAVAPSLGSIDLTPAIMHKAAGGGIMGAAPSLGGYAAGGNPRLLKGPGDGMSDNIPAVIGGRQPARLADGEFVIPADVVSHLGNGSTEAGAKHLHAMMDNVRKARTGRKAQGKQINANKFIPK